MRSSELESDASSETVNGVRVEGGNSETFVLWTDLDKNKVGLRSHLMLGLLDFFMEFSLHFAWSPRDQI